MPLAAQASWAASSTSSLSPSLGCGAVQLAAGEQPATWIKPMLLSCLPPGFHFVSLIPNAGVEYILTQKTFP